MADSNFEENKSQTGALDHHNNQQPEVMGQKCTSVKESPQDGEDNGYFIKENLDTSSGTCYNEEENQNCENHSQLLPDSLSQNNNSNCEENGKSPQGLGSVEEVRDGEDGSLATCSGTMKGKKSKSRKTELKEMVSVTEGDRQESTDVTTPETASKIEGSFDHKPGAKRKLFRRNLRVRTSSEEEDGINEVEINEETKTNLSDSDSSASSGDEDDNGIEEDDPADDTQTHRDYTIEDKLLSKPYPKSQWGSILSERKRQLGLYKTQELYQSQAMGSAYFIQRFTRYGELNFHQGCVNTLHFNQDGTRLASGSDDLKVAIWDWSRKKTVLTYDSGHRRNVFQAKFMPNSADTTVVTCARDGQVRVGELSSTGVCKSTKRVVQHKLPAHKLALEPGSPVVFLSCGEDAKTYSIDLRDPKPTKLVTVKQDDKDIALYTIFINPSNTNEFTVGGRDPFARIYDRRKPTTSSDESTPVKNFCPHHLSESEVKPSITCSVYSFDGQEVLVSYNDEDIYLFDNSHSDGSEYIHKYEGHRNNATVKGVNFYGPQSEFVVSGSDCGNVFLWSKDTERVINCIPGDEGGVVNCLEPHPSMPILATSGLDADIKIFVPTSQQVTACAGVKETMNANRRSRTDDHNREPDQFESQLFMYLLQQLRRSTRRQAREEDDNLVSDDSSNSESEDSDDEDDASQQVRCSPS